MNKSFNSKIRDEQFSHKTTFLQQITSVHEGTKYARKQKPIFIVNNRVKIVYFKIFQ